MAWQGTQNLNLRVVAEADSDGPGLVQMVSRPGR